MGNFEVLYFGTAELAQMRTEPKGGYLIRNTCHNSQDYTQTKPHKYNDCFAEIAFILLRRD